MSVNPDGTIFYTFTGKVFAQGLNLSEVQGKSTPDLPNEIDWLDPANQVREEIWGAFKPGVFPAVDTSILSFAAGRVNPRPGALVDLSARTDDGSFLELDLSAVDGGSARLLAQLSGAGTRTIIAQDGSSDLSPIGMIAGWPSRLAPPTGWLLCDGSAVSRTAHPSLFSVLVPTLGPVTITIASPAVATFNGHGFVTGDSLYFTTTGALPTGLSPNTLYYAIVINANTFNLATSRANADAGTKINTSGTQSGTHTLVACPYGLGDGSTTFNVPDFRGRSPIGSGAGSGLTARRLGESLGEETHLLSLNEIPSHTHQMDLGLTAGSFSVFTALGNPGYTTKQSGAAGGGLAHNTVHPVLVEGRIIYAGV